MVLTNIDTAHSEPFRAAQREHHEFTKTLQPQKLEDEVACQLALKRDQRVNCSCGGDPGD
jgi:hypothetical protein